MMGLSPAATIRRTFRRIPLGFTVMFILFPLFPSTYLIHPLYERCTKNAPTSYKKLTLGTDRCVVPFSLNPDVARSVRLGENRDAACEENHRFTNDCQLFRPRRNYRVDRHFPVFLVLN